MRHVLALLAAVLALAACSPRLHVHTADPAAHRTTIRDAGRGMGVRLKLVDEPGPGAVLLDFHGHDEGVCGAALEKAVGYPEHPKEAVAALLDVAKDPTSDKALAAAREVVDCTPKAWACPKPRYVAHELGHVLGLRHTDGTTMAKAPEAGAEFTDAQRVQMALVAAGFELVCGTPPGHISEPLEPDAELSDGPARP